MTKGCPGRNSMKTYQAWNFALPLGPNQPQPWEARKGQRATAHCTLLARQCWQETANATTF